MSLRSEIEKIFDGKAFERPLFYTYKCGLRMELSEGGYYLDQFLTAHRKALEVCSHIFRQDEDMTVCFKFYGRPALISFLAKFRQLRDLDLFPFTEKEHWVEPDEREYEWEVEENSQEWVWHYLAFNASPELLTNALWLAFTSDFGPIRPRADAMVYLFNLNKEILVFPYDDRGMDIVGPNRPLLGELYNRFNHYLLDFDRKEMDASFSQS